MTRLLMLLGVLIAIVAAAPASADPTPTDPVPSNDDADFLQQLHDAGIEFKDGNQAVAAGKDVCRYADAKTSNDDIVNEIQAGNPSMVGAEARNFMILAANEYCPKYLYEH